MSRKPPLQFWSIPLSVVIGSFCFSLSGSGSCEDLSRAELNYLGDDWDADVAWSGRSEIDALIQYGPGNALTLRAYDLLLEQYHRRSLAYLLHRAIRDPQQRVPDSLITHGVVLEMYFCLITIRGPILPWKIWAGGLICFRRRNIRFWGIWCSFAHAQPAKNAGVG